jgi:hypothetical protein
VYPPGANPATDLPERVATYTYDALGRLQTVSEDLNPASTADQPLNTLYGYDLVGNLRRTDLPNGIITENRFDELNRLDVMTHYAPDVTPADLADNPKLAEFDYSVRADGKRTSVTETYWLDAAENPATPATPRVNHINWTYDDLGRLTDEVFDHFDNTLDQTEHFVHDLVGNRLSLTKDIGNNATIDEAITYSFDVNDRLIDELLDANNDGQTDRTTTYGWTAMQQTSKTVVDNAANQTTSSVTFMFDLQGRMARVATETRISGNVSRRERVTYDYDATGIRIASLHEIDANVDGAYESTTRTEFLVDHHNFTGYQQVLKESTFDDQGNIVKTVEYTFGHEEIAQTVTAFDPQGNATNEATHIFGLGSVRVLFDMADPGDFGRTVGFAKTLELMTISGKLRWRVRSLWPGNRHPYHACCQVFWTIRPTLRRPALTAVRHRRTTPMQYKTILLELLQQHPTLHQQLCTSGMLLETVNRSATDLKAKHKFWIDQLSRSRPASEASQIASEALELAVQEIQDNLQPPSSGNDEATETFSLDAAMSFLRRHTPPA